MNSEIEQIKSRLNIVDVVGEYIKLEKAGINYRALCPFHNEKTPSFFVSPSRQMWHCFGGCNEGGDIFKFVMKIEGIEFIDALKLLAKKAGVQLKTSSKKYEEIKTQREKLLDICKKATIFFSTQLNKSKTGLEAKDYLMKRGLKEETIKEWKIGYAPSTWDSLCNYLIGLGYERKDIIDAGLASEKFFDRFRSRIIFPICDFNGQPVGFTGRVFNSDDEAKYLNTPNTLLYDKSQALYGLDKAKVEIRKNDSCVLVEGNVDCIMSHQSGVKNCLAVSGTALTPAHLGIIKRFSNNLILSFDMDLAGNNATKKGIDMALKNGFNVKVISMNSEKDPADIILSSGEDEWKKIIKEAKPINQFYFDLSFKDRDVRSVEDKKKIVSELLPIFKKIDNTIEQTYWIQKLAEKLSIREDDIRQEMKKVNLPKQEVEVQKEKTGKSRKELLEEAILSMVLIEPSMVETLTEEQKRLFTFLEKENNDSYIIMKSELLKEEDIDINEEWRKCVYEIEKIYKEEKRKKIMADIKEKEKEGSFEEVKKLLLEFNKLTKKDDKK
ncbi:MAG TPA: DNA primase [Candidatus Pacearchaeota archaeon]|jgi:DNA primase|nr:DNA primase [Candidatus Pacearchaeota archaeon]HQB18429.1 DNA primase [Candidatus Pacearchaeota archaeon]